MQSISTLTTYLGQIGETVDALLCEPDGHGYPDRSPTCRSGKQCGHHKNQSARRQRRAGRSPYVSSTLSIARHRIDHIAKPGCLAKIIAGSYPSGPSSAGPPAIWRMVEADEIPAYNVPSGILFDMHREAAAKRPGVLTKIGLDTFA